MTGFKMAIAGLLRRFGYQVTKVGGGLPRRTLADALAHIAGTGFEPTTVIDVGVADGTYELYSAFPKSRFLLVEPLEEFVDAMERICERYNANYVVAAASDRKGMVPINITPDLHGSSLMKPKETGVEMKVREVPTVKIDRLTEYFGLKPPFLLKVDVQSAELKAIMGATKTMMGAEVVILEAQLFQGAEGAPQLYDLAAYMKGSGFAVYDIVGNNYRPLDNALAEVDLVFVKENGMFRQSHHFATQEQRKKQFARPDRRFANA